MTIEKQLIEWRDCEHADSMSAVFNGVTRLSDGKQFEFATFDWDAQVVEYGNDAGVCETYKLELRQGEKLS